MKALPRVLLAVVVLSLALRPPLAGAAQPGKTQNLTAPDQVPEGLAKSDWQSIRAAYEAGRHAFQPIEGGWQARNPGQQWTTKFDGRGFIAEPSGGGWQWGLELKSYGFGDAQQKIGGTPAVKAAGTRLTYQWDANIQEWWVNDQRGLEHGFTVAECPNPPSTVHHHLSFLLAARGTLRPTISADAKGVLFQDASGTTVLHYTGLKVWDADGKVLASHFAPAEGGVRLLVDERGARYPLTIDPIAQQAYLKSGNNGASSDDNFGTSVAVAGDTVVVGAPFEASSTTGVNSTPDESAADSGAAYVFLRSAGVWTQQAYLKPAAVGTTQAGDRFGISVAISGDTVVVGADRENSSTTGVNSTPNESAAASGAAYVFLRSAGVWTQQAYLKPAAVGTTQASDFFGTSVAVSGDTVVVGAFGEGSSTTGVNSTPNESAFDSGAAYVFLRNAGVWTQQAYLKPAAVGTTQAGDRFGISVAISGDTVVVGANFEDSSTTGVNSAPNESASASGAAYVFVRSAGVWSQQAYLKPALFGTTQAGDVFGVSVAISGDTVVVGARSEDSSTTGVNTTPNESAFASGAAYVFLRSAGVWSQQAYLKPAAVGTTQAGDQFGTSVAISGDTVVVGANFETSSTTGVNSTPNESATNSGAAYIFVRNAGVWTQQAYLKPAAVGTTQVNDQFGTSVAVSGDTVVVGAPFEDSNTTGVNSTPNENASAAGAACVFLRSGVTWTQEAYFKASNTPGGSGVNDQFGVSVAVSGDTVVVGANFEDSSTTGVNSTPDESAANSGAAYIFVRSAGVWSQQAYLKPAAVGTTQTNDQFGTSVAISGDTVVVGANFEDSSTSGVNSTPDESAGGSGAAYVFVRSAGVWTQQAYLKPAAVGTIQTSDRFGTSVAVSGDTVVVGANLEDSSTTGVNSTPDESAASSGAAYVFLRSAGVWSEQAYLKPAAVGTTQAGDQFGISVAVSGDRVVVGAHQEGSSTTGVNSTPDESAASSGAAYVFVRFAGLWTQQAYLKPAVVGTTQAGDNFGISVAVSGDTLVVGAISEDSSTTGVNGTPNEFAAGSGAAYVFVRFEGAWAQQAYLKSTVFGATGDQFGISVAVSGDTLVVGANFEDSSTTGVNSTPNESASASGAAYVFVRSAGLWSQQAYLKPATVGTTHASDNFGTSVAVAGDTVVVGAYQEDSSTSGVNSTPNENSSGSGAAYTFTGLGLREIAIEQPVGTGLTSGVSSIGYGGVAMGSSVAKTFTIQNTGSVPLAITSVGVTGGHAGDFSVNTTAMLTSVPATTSTTFSVTFTPAVASSRTTTLRIVNDDSDEATFDITLTGTGLLFTNDTDGDGLNDASEFQLAGLGFDWEVSQPALVAALPGIQNNAGFFTPAQVQALHVGVPLLTKDAATGKFKLTIGVKKTTILTQPFLDFPMTGAGVTTVINGAGQLEFEFTVPDNAAFFRLEAQ